MTALATDRNTARRTGDRLTFDAAASVKCYAGAMAVLDSAGRVKPGVTATGLIPVGRFAETVDNSTGSAGDVQATVEPGIYRFANSAGADEITAAEIGDRCYIVDDQTVAKTDGTGTRSIAGQIVDVDSAGVWVRVGMEVLTTTGLLAANNLSDVGTKATARANLGGGADKIVVQLGSLSTKGADAAVLRFVSPVAGAIAKIYSVLNAALATGNATLTAAINGTPVTGGAITVTESGSAAGDVDSATPSAANTVAAGDVITITGGGSSTATGTATVSLLITPSA